MMPKVMYPLVRRARGRVARVTHCVGVVAFAVRPHVETRAKSHVV